MIAYHEGFETICTVSDSFFSDLESPLLASFVKSNSFVLALRIGRASDSVTSTRRDRTGSIPSSPSETRPVEPTVLYVTGPKPSGTVIFHEKLFDSLAGMSNA